VFANLYDPSPSKDDKFGLAVAASPFGAAATKVLAVSEKNKVWVYYRVAPGAPDVRPSQP
jgi:hypothetical protein